MKRLVSVICILFASVMLFALPSVRTILSGLSESQMDTLLGGQQLEAITSNGESIVSLAPVGTLAFEQASKAQHSNDSFSVGLLAFIPYSYELKSLDEDSRQILLYNTMRSISTQKGITYISHTAGDKPRTLFQESYWLDGPSAESSQVPDPVSSTVLANYTGYAYQKDNKFGGNVYKVDYSSSDTEIFMTINNTTTMKFMGVTCVPSGDLYMYLDVCQTEEGLVLYAMTSIEGRKPQVKILFYTVDLPSAFLRRITALKEWMEQQVQ